MNNISDFWVKMEIIEGKKIVHWKPWQKFNDPEILQKADFKKSKEDNTRCIITGLKNFGNFFCLDFDFDNKEEYLKISKKIKKLTPENTIFEEKTISEGFHMVFSLNGSELAPATRQRLFVLDDNNVIDSRCVGGLIFTYPSKNYEKISKYSLEEIQQIDSESFDKILLLLEKRYGKKSNLNKKMQDIINVLKGNVHGFENWRNLALGLSHEFNADGFNIFRAINEKMPEYKVRKFYEDLNAKDEKNRPSKPITIGTVYKMCRDIDKSFKVEKSEKFIYGSCWKFNVKKATVTLDYIAITKIATDLNYRISLNKDLKQEISRIDMNCIIIPEIPPSLLIKDLQMYIQEIDTEKDIIKIVCNELSKSRHLLSEKYWFSELQYISEADFYKRKKDMQYFFFLNCILKITKNAKEIINYSDYADGFIFESQVIKRNYNQQKVNDKINYFKDFLEKATATEFEMTCSAIGYLLYSYRQSNDKAIVLCDEGAEVFGDAEGGTGKSLIQRALQELKTYSYLDCRNLKGEDRFIFSSYKKGSELFLFEDLSTRDISIFYNKIAGANFSFQKKGKDTINISSSEAPKFLITTNHPVKISGSSDNRRIYEIFINSFWKNKEASVYYNCNFFSDEWTVEDWYNFDEFMFSCLQLYLQKGLFKPIEISKTRYEAQIDSLLGESKYSREFYELLESNDFVFYMTKGVLGTTNDKCYKKEFYAKINEKLNREFSGQVLGKGIKKYCELKNIQCDTSQNNNGRYYIFDFTADDAKIENFLEGVV